MISNRSWYPALTPFGDPVSIDLEPGFVYEVTVGLGANSGVQAFRKDFILFGVVNDNKVPASFRSRFTVPHDDTDGYILMRSGTVQWGPEISMVGALKK